MITLTQLDPLRSERSSDMHENILTPLTVALMNVHKKDVGNPFESLAKIARSEKVKCIAVMISPANESTQQMCQQIGFALGHSQEMGMIEALMEF